MPELFAHLRAGLPPEAELLYDIHERMAPIDAVRLAKALEPYRLFFLEDPLAPEDLGYFRMLRSQCAVPLGDGASCSSIPLEVEPLVSERLIDFVRVHVSTYGGITAALRLAHLCAVFRRAHRLARTERRVPPFGMAANVHLDLHVPNFGIQEWAVSRRGRGGPLSRHPGGLRRRRERERAAGMGDRDGRAAGRPLPVRRPRQPAARAPPRRRHQPTVLK